MLNNAKSVRGIVSHQLEGVHVPQVVRNGQPTWMQRELAVIMGPALRRYEQEQREWNGRSRWRRQIAASARSRLHFITLLFNRAARFTCRETLAVFAWNIRVSRGSAATSRALLLALWDQRRGVVFVERANEIDDL